MARSRSEAYREYQREYQKAYRQRPEVRAKERERSRARVKADPEIARKTNARRRARKFGAYVERIEPLVVLERDDGLCGICGEDVDPARFDVDHIIPLSRGGVEAYYNVQPAHPACNVRKHNACDLPLLVDTRAGRRAERIRRRDEEIVVLLASGATSAEVASVVGCGKETVRIRVAVMRAEGRDVPARKRGYRRDPSKNGSRRTLPDPKPLACAFCGSVFMPPRGPIRRFCSKTCAGKNNVAIAQSARWRREERSA